MASAQVSTSGGEPPATTVADVLLQALEETKIDYIFAVLGSDHPSIVEAYAARRKAGHTKPEMLLFQHEFTAISAADGYARATGRAQCVLVHVDVGTAALGQGMHTASSGKAPMLILAGQAPYTLHGELRGSRSEHVQWYQDVPGQGEIMAPYARYRNEIKGAEHVKTMVERAVLMASTGPCGPSYLTATREVLAAEVKANSIRGRKTQASCRAGGLPEDAVQLIGDALLDAEKPLVVTGYLGRNRAAVEELVVLAELVKGVKVFDFEAREMSFPASHRAWTTRATGAGPAIKSADVILVLDADVPWIPTKVSPSPEARIFHLDIDPRKEYMQLFDIMAEATFNVECELALRQLTAYVRSHPRLPQLATVHSDRWNSLLDSHSAGLRLLSDRARPCDDGLISTNHLFATLRTVLPKNTIYIHDVVTNQVPLTEQLQLSHPGSNLSKGSSGLGWASGAAIGMSLALQRYDISRKPHLSPLSPGVEVENFVCSLTGDGSFIFGSPSAAYWAQYRHSTPFLSVVVNNGGWKATRACLNDVHAEGMANRLSDRELGIDLQGDGPDYMGIAVAASNHTLWAKRVQKMEELEAVIKEATRVVTEEKRGALVEVVVQ